MFVSPRRLPPSTSRDERDVATFPMYSVGGWLNLLVPGRLRAVQEGVSRNVLMLGLTSLFTDISSEMVVSVLPFTSWLFFV